MSNFDRKVTLSARLEQELVSAGYSDALVVGSATDPPIPTKDSKRFLEATGAGFGSATDDLRKTLDAFLEASKK